jgi:hypothetical protein
MIDRDFADKQYDHDPIVKNIFSMINDPVEHGNHSKAH